MIDTGDDKKDTTLDYLGQPAERSFKGQPALPVGGPIGVGAGPATSSAGAGIGSVRRASAESDFTTMLQSLGIDPSTFDGGGGSPDASSNPGNVGQISGIDAPTIGYGLGALASAFPGMIPGTTALGTLFGNLAAKGIDTNLAINTPQGPTPATVTGRGGVGTLLGVLNALFGLNLEGPVTDVAPTAAVNQSVNETPPEIGLEALAAALAQHSVSSTPASAGWTDTFNLTANVGDAAPGGAAPSAGAGGAGGAGSAAGSSGAGGAGTSGAGTGVGESL